MENRVIWVQLNIVLCFWDFMFLISPFLFLSTLSYSSENQKYRISHFCVITLLTKFFPRDIKKKSQVFTFSSGTGVYDRIDHLWFITSNLILISSPVQLLLSWNGEFHSMHSSKHIPFCVFFLILFWIFKASVDIHRNLINVSLLKCIVLITSKGSNLKFYVCISFQIAFYLWNVYTFPPCFKDKWQTCFP